ncbi:MAG: rhomboid family intramembrane serine protease [Porphyromonas sp.]|nr:rhomboid family intramembrane serine protease [Porphyromonas sp.]
MMGGKTSTDLFAELGLVAALLLIYVLVLIMGYDSFAGWMLNGEPKEWLSAPWSIVSYAFVHTLWRHIAVNVGLVLMLILTGTLSAKEFYGLFFGGVIVGGITFLWLGDGVLVGASAGIAALISVALVRSLKRPHFIYLFFVFVLMFESVMRNKLYDITFGVHLAGYVVGLLYLFSCWRQDRKIRTTNDVVEKANVSGYSSLSREERQALRQQHDDIEK